MACGPDAVFDASICEVCCSLQCSTIFENYYLQYIFWGDDYKCACTLSKYNRYRNAFDFEHRIFVGPSEPEHFSLTHKDVSSKRVNEGNLRLIIVTMA